MKKRLLLSASLIALSAPAFAADMPLKAPVRVMTPAWTGLYVGVHGGYTFGDTEWDFDPFGSGFGGTSLFGPALVGGGFTHDNDGWMAGGHMGYNWQIGTVVLGLEGSATWADLKGSTLNPFATFPNPVLPNATYSNKLEWLTTITPRIGVVLNNNWLLYAKAGLAVGQVQTDLSRSGVAFGGFTNFTFSRNAPQMGLTYGLGLEYMLAANWILGVEYNYYNLRFGDLGGMPSPNLTWPVDFSEQMTFHSVLARLSYKFDDNSPVMAFAAAPGAPVSSWSGPYLGVHAGYGFGTADRLYVPGGNGVGGGFTGFSNYVTGSAVGVDVDGPVVGLHAGGNAVWGSVLLGIEAAITGSDIGGKASLALGTPVVSTANYSTDIDWIASVTPRLGFTFGNVLAYGKGGVAVADVRSRVMNNVSTLQFHGDETRLGWTAGGGIEYAWSPQWIVGLEYNYYDFDKATLGGRTNPFAGGWPVQYDEEVKLSTVTARLTYKFNK